MRVHVVDPSAYTLPYDHSLCTALSDAGVDVELITSRFSYGDAPTAERYAIRELFYRRVFGPAGSRRRLLGKLLAHGPDMVRYRRAAAEADVVHFQWLAVQALDRRLLPRRPTVLTAHDLLPREPRPLQVRAQRLLYHSVDAVVVHSEHGRAQLVDLLGVEPAKVRVIHHGAFGYLTGVDGQLPPELPSASGPVVLFFGLLRPYKGLDVLLEAWRSLSGLGDAELWIVGHPRIDIGTLRRLAPRSVRFVLRFVSEGELAACFRRADLVVLPYTATERIDFSGVLATALAFGAPAIVSDVGSFGEVAAAGAALVVPPGDSTALAAAIEQLLADEGRRAALASAAAAAAAGPYSWGSAAADTIALYGELIERSTRRR